LLDVVVRLNAVPGLRATVTALPGQQPPRIRLTAGSFAFTVDPEEALALADRLVDAVERIRATPNPNAERTADHE
jgi:hypothetical protein